MHIHSQPPPDMADAFQALQDARPDLRLDLRWYPSLPSTMDEAAHLAEQGVPAAVVVVAGEQTAGRGRRGRTWSSPPGTGLHFTYVARPRHRAGLVTLAAGVGVQRGLAVATGLQAHLKWPNDVMIGRRKLAGLLAEGARMGTPDAAVLIGVGLNLRAGSHPPDVNARATSLEEELGRAVDGGHVLVSVIEHLADALVTLEHDVPGTTLDAWRYVSPSSQGTRVEWQDGGLARHGVTAGIDETGALLVQTTDGTERIIAGELQWFLRP